MKHHDKLPYQHSNGSLFDKSVTKQAASSDYRAFFDFSHDLFWILNLRGKIIDLNSALIQRLGYSKQELIGKSILLIFPERYRESALQKIRSPVQNKIIFCDIPLITNQGELVDVETTIVKGWWNNKPALFGSSRDINILKTFREKYCQAFQVNPAMATISRFETGEMVEVNKSVYDFLGYEPEDFFGKSATRMTIIDEKTRSLMMKAFKKQGKLTNWEASAITRQGEKIPCLFSVNTIEHGHERYLYTTALSIRTLKEKQQVLTCHQRKLEQIIDEYGEKLEHERIKRKSIEKEISKKNILLAEKNITLKQLLDQREKEKQEIREDVSKKVQNLILPLIGRIQANGTDSDKKYLKVLLDNLKEIVSPLNIKAGKKMSVLSSRQLEVCNLIIQGCNSKDIAEMLCLSVQTVNTHRKNIRKKLGISSRGVNLATYIKFDDPL
ncbi:MAG: PAS domain S-box protein [Deltaproteobacteria bacterium]|nr:PAS domain S-box protein [Deltaproteobacteria bacterium]